MIEDENPNQQVSAMNAEEMLQTEEAPTPHCKHYVVRKKRYCRMTLKQGQEYCGEHMPSTTKDGSEESKRRIVCPLDNKHTCYAHKLSKHLKICNAQVINKPFMLKNINSGESNANVEQRTRLLADVPVSHIKTLIGKINKLYDDVLKQGIPEKILSHVILEEELLKTELGNKRKKHLCQASSTLGYLREYNLLRSNTCYVEFGAGKGQLSYWISRATENIEGTSVLLVEKASHRHKMDNKLDKSEGRVHRVRVDIADLLLHKIDVVSSSKYVVAVTKHLCGDATDLALHCLKNYQEQRKSQVLGVTMAFCCHHRCQWQSYTGRSFFEANGLTCDDFNAMCGMVSWATCGTGFSRDKNTQIDMKDDLPPPNDREREIGLTKKEKEHIGIKCKSILNYGRLLFLCDNGFHSELYRYVKLEISLENLFIVAVNENIPINT